MSEYSPTPHYTDLAIVLTKMKSNHHASQLHGFICGLICGRTPEQNQTGGADVLSELQQSVQSRKMIQQLYAASFRDLSEFSFEFALLLPDDDTEINQRSESLGLWCQGFLTGLEQAYPDIQTAQGDVADVLSDLLEISQVSFGDIEEDDESEAAYAELVEYVRMSILMVYQELHTENDMPLDVQQLH